MGYGRRYYPDGIPGSRTLGGGGLVGGVPDTEMGR